MRPGEEGDRRASDRAPAPSSSAQVQLELAVLAAALEAERASAWHDPSAVDAIVVLIVAREPDERAYIADCLCSRPDLRTMEAASAGVAVALAGLHPPRLLIVDLAEADILRQMPDTPAIVIVDEVDEERRRMIGGAGGRTLLARPFNARTLLAYVAQYLRPDATK
jgi:CheY-like chemotaxis protein